MPAFLLRLGALPPEPAAGELVLVAVDEIARPLGWRRTACALRTIGFQKLEDLYHGATPQVKCRRAEDTGPGQEAVRKEMAPIAGWRAGPSFATGVSRLYHGPGQTPSRYASAACAAVASHSGESPDRPLPGGV